MRELLEIQAIFKGRVQGVGFRATVKAYAQQLKLTGFVRNLPDGDVEIRAQGEKSSLERLLEKVKAEFEIEEISHQFSPIKEPFKDFQIRF